MLKYECPKGGGEGGHCIPKFGNGNVSPELGGPSVSQKWAGWGTVSPKLRGGTVSPNMGGTVSPMGIQCPPSFDEDLGWCVGGRLGAGVVW